MKDALFFFTILLTSATSLLAETKTLGDYVVTLKATKPDAIYKIGDTAQFELSIKKGKEEFSGADINYQISKDSVAPFKIGEKKNASSSEKFSGKLDEAGFLKCKVWVKFPDQKKKLEMLASAGFSPTEIAPSLPVPEDFKQYWDSQKEILKTIPMNIVIKPANNVLLADKSISKSIKNSVDMFHVTADTVNGKLDAYMCMPKGAKMKSLPIVVLPHGAGVRLSRYGGTAGAAVFAKAGFLALDFNALGLNSSMSAEEFKQAQKKHRGYHLKNADNRDTNFFRTLYLRLCRAMDVAMAQPQWDGKTLVVFGTSQGGGQALAAGGLYNDKVTMVLALVPAICDQTGVVKNRVNGWPHYIKPNPKTGKYGEYDKNLLNAIRYIDVMNFSAFIKAETIFVVDLSDNVCEPTSCFAAYANIKSPKTLITNPEARHTVPRKCYLDVVELVKKHAKAKSTEGLRR